MSQKALTVYGKKTCVSCKKALELLDTQQVAYDYHEIESDPPAKALLDKAVDANDVKASLNTRSKIYKDQGLGQTLPDKARAIQLMQQDPNLIKRPLIVDETGRLYLGFDADGLKAFLK